jgi:uncharacterized membrane protein
VSFWLAGTPGANGHLAWLTPTWIVVAAAIAALVAFVAAIPGNRSLLSRLAELGAWAAALVGLVAMVAGPLWVEEEGRTEPGRVAVLVDASRSMGVVEGGQPRSASVDAILSSVASQSDSVDWYSFGDDLAVGRPETYDLPGTDLEGALDALSERVAGEKLAGIVVVTDGLDRGLLRRRFHKEKDPLPPELPGPLTVFQVGKLGDVTDLSVASVDTGGFGFIRHPFKLTADIEGIGFGGRTIPVTLLRDGATVTTQSVALDAAGKATATFEVTPDDDGRFTYAVSVPLYEGDAVPANNVMPVVVRIVRDRIRVLQVAGTPSWDVKFLRRFLKSDPSVDLISFFILRTQDDMSAAYDDRELSLIAFPYEQLFEEDLWTFDVVIFQNFDYDNYFARGNASHLLGNVAEYVKTKGHAFAMIGGDRSFELGRYGGTPLGEILPVQLSDRPVPADEQPFLPALTDEGARHPITRVLGDPGDNRAWWAESHPLDGTNLPLQAAPGAAVLLAHPSRKGIDGKPLPILAVREVGKGRTMALTVDSSWRWSLSEAAEGRGNQPYLRFWKNALRWLVEDPSVARVTVETPRENYAVGDDVRIVVTARDPGFAPLDKGMVSATVTASGEPIPLEGRTDAEGELVLTIPADRSGTHRVHVSVKDGDKEVGTADTVYAVTTRDPELDEVAPDTAFLQWLASRSGGRYRGAGDLGPILLDPESGRTVWDRRETPLWRAPLLAAWCVGFAGVAWVIRRRAGLR